MGLVGSALDNAAEALNSTLKVAYVHRQHFATRAEARVEIATWITEFHSTRRRHSARDWLSPIDCGHSAATREAAAAQPNPPRSEGIDHLRNDLTAATAGPTPPWSNGRVEGQGNRHGNR